MKDVESQLRGKHLARPSEQLDRRVEALLLESAIEKQRRAHWRVPAGLAAAACVACAALGYFAAAWQRPAAPETRSEQVLYIVQGSSAGGNVFDLPVQTWPAAETRLGRAYVIEFQDEPGPAPERRPSI